MIRKPAVLLVFRLTPDKQGSIEDYIASICAELTRAGYECVLAFTGMPSDALRAKFVEAGANVVPISDASSRTLWVDILRCVRKYKPQIVHLHFLEQFSIGPILLKLSGVKKVIITDHCRTTPKHRSTGWKCGVWDAMLLGPLGIEVVAVSEYVRSVLIDYFGVQKKRVGVLLNGVDTTRFRPADPSEKARLREELGFPGDKRIVLSVAHLISEKGIDRLLDAAPEIQRRIKNVLILVIGTGPLLEELRNKTSALHLDDTVAFLGKRSDVDQFMRLADVVVVPSVWEEPAGLVTVEAMASGCPVVAAAVGGIPEYLGSDAGLLVSKTDLMELSTAVVQILESPEQAVRMGLAGVMRARAKFSMAHWVQGTLGLYGEIQEKRCSVGLG